MLTAVFVEEYGEDRAGWPQFAQRAILAGEADLEVQTRELKDGVIFWRARAEDRLSLIEEMIAQVRTAEGML